LLALSRGRRIGSSADGPIRQLAGNRWGNTEVIRSDQSTFHLFFADPEESSTSLAARLGHDVTVDGEPITGQSLKNYREGEVYFEGKGPVIEIENLDAMN